MNKMTIKKEMKNNMKTKFILSLLVICFLSFVAVAKTPKDQKQESKGSLSNSAGAPTYQILNINNLTTWHAHDGKSNHSPGGVDGTRFPRNAYTLIYQDGVVWGGKVFTDTGRTTPAALQPVRVGGGTYGVGTKAGWINGTGATATAEPITSAGVKIYRVRRDFKSMSQNELKTDAAESYEKSLDEVSSGEMAAIITQYQIDWDTWPVAKGAPYIERNGTAGYQAPPAGWAVDDLIANKLDEPGLAGSDPNSPADQVLWTVYNDLDATQATGFLGSNPIGIECQKTIWGYKRSDALGNIYFGKYKLINKGGAATEGTTKGTFTIDSMYVCQWSDPDMGTFSDDIIGCDTLLSMGYVYNANAIDQVYRSYGYPPPAAGYDFLQGPAVPSVAGDSAVVDLKYVKGKKNLGMSSFSYFSAGSAYSDPPGGAANYDAGSGRWWKMLRGFAPLGDFKTADIPYASGPFAASKFPLSGDPVKRTGFLDGLGQAYSVAPGDRRLLLSTGPFRMAPQEAQEIVVGLVCGMGSDRLSSVSVMKFNDQFAQNTYNGLFAVASAPAAPSVGITELNGKIVLDWGSNLTVVKNTETKVNQPGGYRFEGYNLYQLPSKASTLAEAKRIATFDTDVDPTTVLDIQFDQRSGQILSIPVQFGSNSGISRNFVIDRDWVKDIGKLNNGQEYYFAVTAYSVATVSGFLPAALESSPLIYVAKSKIPFGTSYANKYGDTLAYTKHIVTGSGVTATDGNIVPIVVNPSAANGKSYRVDFTKVNDETSWKLTNTTDNKVVITNQTNQDDNDQHSIVEGGVFLKVLGPPPGLKRNDMYDAADPNLWGWNWTAGTRFLTWAGGGNYFGLESFQGAVGYASPAYLFNSIARSVTPDKLPKIEIRFANLTHLTDTTATFDSTQANVSKAYRYLRNAAGVPAQPRFAPFIVNPGSGNYGFQDYNRSMPLAVWDVDKTPARRLSVGYLENNAAYGNLDGQYVPPLNTLAYKNNGETTGPREWLFIMNTNYSETANPAFMNSILSNDNTVMYTATWALRNKNAWKNTDVLTLNPTRVNTANHYFLYSLPLTTKNDSLENYSWEKVGVYPNPYYASNAQETNRFSRFVVFNNLPKVVKIKIYNLAGQLVRTLSKDDSEQFLKWDLLNTDNFPIASGMYIAYVTSTFTSGEKTKILKLGVIQEQEILTSF